MKNHLIPFIFFIFIAIGNTNAIEIHKFYSFDDSLVVTAEKQRPIPRYSSIATKSYVPLQKLPLSVGVVNSALVDDQNNFVLGDALKNISGVNTQTGFGVHDYFVIRGLNSLDNGLILTDGTREPEVTYYNLYNVERIEVLKGPGAFLYGSNPLSGTVNLVRKRPVFRKFLNLNSTVGQYKTFRNSLDVGWGDPRHGLASRLNMLWENSDNYRDDKENSIVAINPSLTYYPTPSMTVNLNLEYINSQYKPDAGLPLVFDMSSTQFNQIADVPRTRSYQTPFDASEQEIVRVKLDVDKKLNSFLDFQTKLFYTRLDWTSRGTLLNGASPNKSGVMMVNRSQSYLEDLRNLFGMQNELMIKLATGRIKHNIAAGIEWRLLQEDYVYDIAPSIPAINLDNPVETAKKEQIAMYPYLRGDVQNRVIAPYVVDQISFTEQLQVTAGLRYDMIEFENTATGYKTDRSYENFSPLLGINYSPIPEVALYANTGSAYAPPSSQVIGEQDAEKSIQYEAGFKQRYFDGKVQLDLAYYHLTKENITIPGLDGISRQSGDLESKGVELELRAEPLPRWYTLISYAYSDVKYTTFHERVQVGMDESFQPVYMVMDRSGNHAAFAPEHILNIWTTKELNNGLGFGGGVRYLSDQYIYADNVFELDPALIVDAIVYFKLNKMKISLNARNLTNEEYEMRGFGATSVIPAPARSVYAKLGISL